MTTAADSRVRAPQLADWALAHGRAALTTQEMAEALGVPPGQVSARLAAPAARHEWVSPVRGLWLPVAPEFRTWGAPPGVEMIDLVATHLSLDYYVGWLSAAQLHGAAHQAPQTFQVAVSRQLRDRGIGRTAFQFRLRSDIPKVPVVHHPTRAGQARVSTPESTAVDIATDVTLSGGIDNAATVILELDEVCDLDRFELVRLAATVPAAAVRRMGFTLDRLGGRGGMDDLRALALAGPPTPARLDPSAAATGPVDPRWMVRLNREVEVDW